MIFRISASLCKEPFINHQFHPLAVIWWCFMVAKRFSCLGFFSYNFASNICVHYVGLSACYSMFPNSLERWDKAYKFTQIYNIVPFSEKQLHRMLEYCVCLFVAWVVLSFIDCVVVIWSNFEVYRFQLSVCIGYKLCEMLFIVIIYKISRNQRRCNTHYRASWFAIANGDSKMINIKQAKALLKSF